MGNSGVGMLLGDTSATLLWVWFIGAFVLGGAILYGVMKSGLLAPRRASAAGSQHPSCAKGATIRRSAIPSSLA
jgi:hypothetical protein